MANRGNTPSCHIPTTLRKHVLIKKNTISLKVYNYLVIQAHGNLFVRKPWNFYIGTSIYSEEYSINLPKTSSTRCTMWRKSKPSSNRYVQLLSSATRVHYTGFQTILCYRYNMMTQNLEWSRGWSCLVLHRGRTTNLALKWN